MTTQMLKYIKSIIDDDYAMEVLYYSIRKTIADNDFTLKGTTAIKISNKFLESSVVININHRFTKQLEAFSLLLSVRALMLDKTLIEYCDGDMLLFEEYPTHKFGWIAYTTMIMDCMKDDDFSDIYSIIESAYTEDDLSDDDKEYFIETTRVPEYRNLPNYYREVAKNEKGVTSEVVCNNAFVCDDNLKEYVVPENIAYIGNTAFSYCNNLTTLTFERNDVLFGKFSIVECDSLRRIMVPTGFEEYYKNALPFYKNIIFSQETLKEYDEAKAKVWEMLSSSGHEQNEQEEIEVEHMFLNKETGDYVPASKLKERVESHESSMLRVSPPQMAIAEVVNTSTPKNNTTQPIDPKKLKSVFDKKVTSYKYFWFISIITLLKEKGELTISFQDLVIRMAAQAWPIIFNDKLELGSRDMMKKYLLDLKGYTSLTESSSSSAVENWLHNRFSTKVKRTLDPLLKNVPFRFLSPWIKYISDDDVIEKSNSTDYAALYALHNDQIIMDEDWYDYILENYDDIYKFAKESLTDYLKQYNNALALIGFMSRL